MWTPVFVFILVNFAIFALTHYINRAAAKRLETKKADSTPKSNEVISILPVIEKDEKQGSENPVARKPNDYDEIRRNKPHIWID